MHYVYVLKSLLTGRYYVGYTIDVDKRLAQHNAGLSRFTKHDKPWEIVYLEAYKLEKFARERERQLKRFSQAWTALKIRAGLDFLGEGERVN
ncbi:MAG: GIY-YIG nuclease family protein [Candidatus Berkelbacteria bacterium]|nr:GIY-YIG nuclease family protein [Candidatus Berkelbacteria bacterium]